MVTVPIPGFGTLSPVPLPAPPQCEARTAPKWYRREGGRCPFRAKYATGAGTLLCMIHVKQAVRATRSPTRESENAASRKCREPDCPSFGQPPSRSCRCHATRR